MELRIETKSWKLTTTDEGQKIIVGSFVVKSGKVTVAEKDFNEGYSNMNIAIPAKIVAKAEEIDKEICQVIVESFNK